MILAHNPVPHRFRVKHPNAGDKVTNKGSLATLCSGVVFVVGLSSCNSTPSTAQTSEGTASPAAPASAASPGATSAPAATGAAPGPGGSVQKASGTPSGAPEGVPSANPAGSPSGELESKAAAAATAVVTPPPKPTVPPAQTSPWLRVAPLAFDAKSRVPSSLVESARTEVTESSRDEQFSLLPSQTGGAQKDVLFFQRRYTPSERFAIFSQSSSDNQSGELLRNMPQIYDALVYCPLSNEIVFQAPPMDAGGKFIVRARPTRVYLFSLDNGRMELIWRREKDREGTFVPRMSATPDCRHVLINLQLENPGNKVPYGELVYLRRPPAQAASKRPVTIEWTSSTVNESAKNGVWKGFGEALFVQPRSPSHYVPSELPPPVFAITDMVEKDKNVPLVNVFLPSGGARISQAAGVRWQRERIKAEGSLRDLFSPATDNAGDAVFMVAETNEKGASGAFKRSLVAFEPRRLGSGMKTLVNGGETRFFGLDVHPSGTRLVASYVHARTESQVGDEASRNIAGVAEFTLDKAAKPQWSEVFTMMPFHSLEGHHDPRPVYSADGSSLYFVQPQIGDLPEAALFSATAKVNKELQFGSKLMKIGVPEAK